MDLFYVEFIKENGYTAHCYLTARIEEFHSSIALSEEEIKENITNTVKERFGKGCTVLSYESTPLYAVMLNELNVQDLKNILDKSKFY